MGGTGGGRVNNLSKQLCPEYRHINRLLGRKERTQNTHGVNRTGNPKPVTLITQTGYVLKYKTHIEAAEYLGVSQSGLASAIMRSRRSKKDGRCKGHIIVYASLL